eukprot:CAMPEP_0117010482 /NCGR_PEP_ID=MMETSP0472-20121206/9227_1 /TAXON_ID=693140 ORGANISM="Tiarina fusus, Strain LIS" /NCGR_SAMPLE_ID=MMETSP0472 /ASSEMBLY_ACC=CAM_ASM_000603 /LENGTH=129 /DNA_ID=CAMNT_0004713025 /DNA_START=8 /DNA_END=394 /DNA_ORIENTATION=-
MEFMVDDFSETNNDGLPSFEEVIRGAGRPQWQKQNNQQFLDDLELSVQEDSLSHFLFMKTGMVYLGSMGAFGSYQVAKNVISKQMKFRQIAGSLAANVPKRVNSVASIVFCATSAYAVSALSRGKRDSW